MNIFVDASFLVALINKDDPSFGKADKIIKNLNDVSLFSNQIVKYEAVNVISRKWGIAQTKKFMKWLKNSELTIISINEEIWQIAYKNLIKSFTKKGPNLFDYLHFATMKKYQIKQVLTFDKHFQSFGFQTLP
ncbi:type II toxin-antitoxin system VapC family toxin [Patescibacteria group bacterium]|nr:type II toxin-antitoxin system VapC family toxin [Patescibacteria group bacterium]MCG2702737.1 type II toxin-antitoxin system VapC family toxin [Candidatus Parcubacteria bacterium]MBU4265437.1 type II toxin-antitoxin system VapC family toxin [Patescibacteria group bacterium]MBU4390487.1 type II toxin-antitoxin system VapC family toxin [Patescibacteria group bacterium]MBU4397054.1 type II toxin-antitoxin system VapC family toxin [Patescibacteria group bacterium]